MTQKVEVPVRGNRLDESNQEVVADRFSSNVYVSNTPNLVTYSPSVDNKLSKDPSDTISSVTGLTNQVVRPKPSGHDSGQDLPYINAGQDPLLATDWILTDEKGQHPPASTQDDDKTPIDCEQIDNLHRAKKSTESSISNDSVVGIRGSLADTDCVQSDIDTRSVNTRDKLPISENKRQLAEDHIALPYAASQSNE